MKLDTKCKFCGKSLSIEIDPVSLEVPICEKLIPLIACERCAGLRERRRTIINRIRAVCWEMQRQPDAKLREALKEAAVVPLRGLLMQWRGLAEDWNGGETGEWDESLLQDLLGEPDKSGKVLDRIWSLSRQRRLSA